MIGELAFSKVDIAIHESGPHLKPSEVATDVTLAAQRIRIGPSLSPAAFSVELECDTEAEATRQLTAICKLGRLSAVPLVTVAAGSIGNGMDAEVKRLAKLSRLVHGEGLTLTVTTQDRDRDRDAGGALASFVNACRTWG